MFRRGAVILISLVAACEPPAPIRAASGERIAALSYEEGFPLSNETHDVSFSGDRLRRAVEMMDRAGVLALSGAYAASGVLDKSTLTIAIRSADDKERKVVVKNCAEPHVCTFFADAVKNGLVEKTPVVCRNPVPCAKK